MSKFIKALYDGIKVDDDTNLCFLAPSERMVDVFIEDVIDADDLGIDLKTHPKEYERYVNRFKKVFDDVCMAVDDALPQGEYKDLVLCALECYACIFELRYGMHVSNLG